MHHFKESLPMTYRRRFDFSALVLATLVVIQAGIASYAFDGLVRDIARTTYARLTAVAESTR